MKSIFRKPAVVFLTAFLVLSAIFFLIPVNVFDAEYIYNVNGITAVRQSQVSLSYFIGISESPQPVQYLVSVRLLPMGYFMVFLFLVALPLLIAYRVKLANQNDNDRA